MKNIQLALSRPVGISKELTNALGIAAFALLTILTAFVRVPLPYTPVPLTLQTLAVLGSAGFLGRKAAVSQALYLALGAAGLPVFQGAAGGIGHLLGPTGGYLAGFVAAAYMAGWALERPRPLAMMALVMVMASLIILVLGAGWLAVLMKLDHTQALNLGLAPFLAGDMVKSALAALAVWGWRRRQ